MSGHKWWAVPADEYRLRRGITVEMRPWEAGDGMRCSASGAQQKSPCGEPVAVIRYVYPAEFSRPQKIVHKVGCLRHAAALFTGAASSIEDPADERAALEILAKAHWDEFQEILADRINQRYNDRLGALPNELRTQIMASLLAGIDAES